MKEKRYSCFDSFHGAQESLRQRMPLARSRSVFQACPLPGVRALGWKVGPLQGSRTLQIPEVDGNRSHRVPKGQPAGNTQVSWFAASKIWSSMSPLEFAQKEEKRRTQQELSGSRVVSSLGSLEPALAFSFQPNPKVTGAG